MVSVKPHILRVLVLTWYVHACMATADCKLSPSDPKKVAYTINVDVRGGHKFKSVQKAIDSIPPGNNKWIRIFLFRGVYMEKVEIPKDKGCIFMEGEKGPRHTAISWGAHEKTDTSATFTAYPDNIAVKGITFKNTYILSKNRTAKMKQAVAVRLYGDKYAFYRCNFVGLQDTLWDALGRHYFKRSFISGAVDFIWGSGQSLYEECALNVTIGVYEPHRSYGTITAQGRGSKSDPGGFVFKGCTVTGKGKTLLGRAYGPYSRVIFYRSQLFGIVHPLGWDAWNFKGHEDKITYVEAEDKGPGARTSQRVPWLKKMSKAELTRFVSLSYIDQEGWTSKLPVGALA